MILIQHIYCMEMMLIILRQILTMVLLAGVGYLVVLILRQKGIILSVDDYGNYGFRFTVASVLLAIGIAGMIAYVMERRRMNAEAAEK